MTDGSAWQGNWKARIYERLRERGYKSLTAFAEARPAVPLYALAEELGEDDVAGVQVLNELLSEAEQRKQVTRFVRDVLVRLAAPPAGVHSVPTTSCFAHSYPIWFSWPWRLEPQHHAA